MLIALASAVIVVNEDAKRKRKSIVMRQHVNFDFHISQLLEEGQFIRFYRMSFSSFEKLVKLVCPKLAVNEHQSKRRRKSNSINAVSRLQMAIMWLAGGSHHQIRFVGGNVSVPFFYANLHRVLDAIICTTELDLVFPNTKKRVQEMALGFRDFSTENILSGCIGCIDGWLCEIRMPASHEVGRVQSFFSGHYARYGINVQACCDFLSRFTAFSANCPGGMGDALAFQKWKLSTIIDKIDGPYYLIGDNGYVQSAKVMTPFNKIELQVQKKSRDAYNFYLSQLRIRIEMAFGLLVSKWRVLKSKLNVKIANATNVIHVCMRLHNFVISERSMETDFKIEKEYNDMCKASNIGEGHLLYDSTIIDGNEYKDEDSKFALGHAFRQALVKKNENHNLNRPIYNVQ